MKINKTTTTTAPATTIKAFFPIKFPNDNKILVGKGKGILGVFCRLTLPFHSQRFMKSWNGLQRQALAQQQALRFWARRATSGMRRRICCPTAWARSAPRFFSCSPTAARPVRRPDAGRRPQPALIEPAQWTQKEPS